MRGRVVFLAAIAASALWLGFDFVWGQQRNQPTELQPIKIAAPPSEDQVIVQNFPPKGAMETAWKVEWDVIRGHGLIVKNAWFKSGPDKEWMQVLGDARLADIFVPYQPGVPRFWDVRYNFRLSTMSEADAGPFGKLHSASNGGYEDQCVVEELRDRGVIWKNNDGVRRGHTMVLWGCLHATNYRYLIEYGFQDDGCVTFRVGATGRNLNGNEWTPHMHNYYWRVDINLGGPDHNTAYLMENVEPSPQGRKSASQTFHTLFNEGKEGYADWDPLKYTMLRVKNTKNKNIRGENNAYDLMPLRAGTSRHFGSKEECTQHDFWVTKANSYETNYRNVSGYCNGETIENTDIVLWYGTGMFHEPRSEDGIFEGNWWTGATIVGWSGFTLRPNNVFDRTPMFPNPKSVVPQK